MKQIRKKNESQFLNNLILKDNIKKTKKTRRFSCWRVKLKKPIQLKKDLKNKSDQPWSTRQTRESCCWTKITL